MNSQLRKNDELNRTCRTVDLNLIPVSTSTILKIWLAFSARARTGIIPTSFSPSPKLKMNDIVKNFGHISSWQRGTIIQEEKRLAICGTFL